MNIHFKVLLFVGFFFKSFNYQFLSLICLWGADIGFSCALLEVYNLEPQTEYQIGCFLKKINLFNFNRRLITLQYCGGFCHTKTWISHGCTCFPHLEPTSHLSCHPIPQGCPSALALSALFHALNLDWWSISHMVIYMFQCYSLKSPHPCLLPQSPKDCSLYLCLFCCPAYRVMVTIFLNSIYMH